MHALFDFINFSEAALRNFSAPVSGNIDRNLTLTQSLKLSCTCCENHPVSYCKLSYIKSWSYNTNKHTTTDTVYIKVRNLLYHCSWSGIEIIYLNTDYNHLNKCRCMQVSMNNKWLEVDTPDQIKRIKLHFLFGFLFLWNFV